MAGQGLVLLMLTMKPGRWEKRCRRWAFIELLLHLVDVFMNGEARSVHVQLKQQLLIPKQVDNDDVDTI